MKKSYSELLKDPRWQKKRLEILTRDNFTCRLCKDDKTSLQVHHKGYIKGRDPWDYENEDLITLCEHCHKEVESICKNPSIQFNDILHITKIVNTRTKGRIMVIVMQERCLFKIFDHRELCISSFLLSGDAIEPVIESLQKSLQYV